MLYYFVSWNLTEPKPKITSWIPLFFLYHQVKHPNWHALINSMEHSIAISFQIEFLPYDISRSISAVFLWRGYKRQFFLTAGRNLRFRNFRNFFTLIFLKWSFCSIFLLSRVILFIRLVYAFLLFQFSNFQINPIFHQMNSLCGLILNQISKQNEEILEKKISEVILIFSIPFNKANRNSLTKDHLPLIND